VKKPRKNTKVIAAESVGRRKAQARARERPRGPRGAPVHRPFPIVGIGASAGGLEAFTRLLKHLTVDTGMAFVLVPHLDPEHESALVQLLARATSMPVREVANDLPVVPNHVYVIPPNTVMGITSGVLKLSPRADAPVPHRSIDHFFESLAKDQCHQAIGVILSGTASDGTLGLEAIKAEGGITFAQDESAKYDSMPRSAISAGCVDFVLTPENIAEELARIAKHPYIAGEPVTAASPAPESESEPAEAAPATDEISRQLPRASRSPGRPHPVDGTGFEHILSLLRSSHGVDFSVYKSSTVERRLIRRMVLNKLDTLDAYARLLRKNSRELDALYSDMLISVTSFFRNPEVFEILKREVFPKLIAMHRRNDPLRAWVLGCSTGQEAYSVAFSFLESCGHAGDAPKLQIFATDLNENLLFKARAALYPKSLVADVSPDRLRRFFIEEAGGYRVQKFVRNMVVFARHDLLSDPPFSRMDVVSCRNLLIYLEPTLQQQVVPLFHYALMPEGCMILGMSESVGPFTNLFAPIDTKHKLYSKKAAPTPALHSYFLAGHSSERKEAPALERAAAAKGFAAEPDSNREVDRVILNRWSPPGVLINDDLQILQFRGTTAPFLKPPSGKPSFDVLKMAREDLVLPLRDAIIRAKKEGKPVRRENVRPAGNSRARATNIEVIPLENLKPRAYLVLFEQAGRGLAAREPGERESAGPRRRVKTKVESRRIAGLESELAETRDYLQSVQQQSEAAHEEIQAANEELQSANEELQSTNEELETSKEELESTNEELTTVNEEMVHRNAELARVSGDLKNLHISLNIAILLLGRDLTIRGLTPLAEKTFNLAATDVGRPLRDVKHSLDCPDLVDFAAGVIDSISLREREVQDREGRWFLLRARPYMTLDNQMDGVVLALLDIDALKRSEREIEQERNYAQAVIESVPPLVVLDGNLRVKTANASFYEHFRVSREETHNLLVYEMGNGQWNIPKLRHLLEDIVPRNSFFNEFEVTHDFPVIGRRTMLLNARRLDRDGPFPQLIVLFIQDITERMRLAENTTLLAAIVEATDDAISTVSVDGVITSWNLGSERMYGYTAAEMVGNHVTRLLPPDRLHEWAQIADRLRGGDRLEAFETVRVRKDGALIHVSLSVSSLYDRQGQPTGFALIARDITARKQAEEERERLLGLERAARSEAEAANRAKDDFLATVSHELRTPLNAMLGWSTLLRTRTPDAATSARGLQSIERNARLQAQLIEDILDISRVIAGKTRLEFRALDLTQIIDAAIDTVRPAADAKSIQIRSQLDPEAGSFLGDPDRLQQILWNMLSNAVKFTPSEGRVDVRLQRLGSDVQIIVSDTGKGISADFLPYIFDRFRQADSTSVRKHGGLGLGLAIVRHLVEMHGGTVCAESRGEGQGATFTVRLPVADSRIEEKVSAAGAREHGAFQRVAQVMPPGLTHRIEGVHVLLVDDEPDTLEMLRVALEQCGAEVRTSVNVAGALQALQQWKPDVLVSDIAMPERDGFDLIANVRALERERGGRIPALALTAYVRVGDRARVLEAGYDIFVPKPVEPSELVAALAGLAGRGPKSRSSENE
jgi:two-component system CheB/CheR fusion protein